MSTEHQQSATVGEATQAAKGFGPDQLEQIVRRAAQLQAAEGEGAPAQFSEQEVIRIAGEVGLSPVHVRRALREQSVKLPKELVPPDTPWQDRLFGPAVIRVDRGLSRPAGAVQAAVESQLEAEGLQAMRRGEGVSVWEPSADLEGIIRRSLDFSGRRYRLAGAEQISAAVQPLEARYSHVSLLADLSKQRQTYLSGWSLGLGLAYFALWGGVMGAAEEGGVSGLTLSLAILASLAGMAWAVYDIRKNMRKNGQIFSLVLNGLLDRVRPTSKED